MLPDTQFGLPVPVIRVTPLTPPRAKNCVTPDQVKDAMCPFAKEEGPGAAAAGRGGGGQQASNSKTARVRGQGHTTQHSMQHTAQHDGNHAAHTTPLSTSLWDVIAHSLCAPLNPCCPSLPTTHTTSTPWVACLESSHLPLSLLFAVAC
jgi:hypothetical protein